MPVAIASSLGLGHVKLPIAAPFNLGLNGNAITVSPALHGAITAEIDGDRFDPMATALALARVVAKRRKSGAEPLTFGMTFPFSTHNYQLRFWMAGGGVDPDGDVRLVPCCVGDRLCANYRRKSACTFTRASFRDRREPGFKPRRFMARMR